MRMKANTTVLATLAVLLAAQSAFAGNIIVPFGAVGSAISFVGDGTGTGATFSFVPGPSGSDMTLSDGLGDTLLADITGSFAFSGINTVGALETSTVTDLGKGGTPNELVIHDGQGSDFTAVLNWTNITTYVTGTGLETINITGGVDLSQLSYSGSNQFLAGLAGDSLGQFKVSA